MNPEELINKYYGAEPELEALLLRHSRDVAKRALAIVDAHPELRLDRNFVREAALLHDIGIRFCYAPTIGCHGTHPYLLHGPLGAQLLRGEGLPRHARVAERHTGTGLRGLVPETLEEQIICYADKFYSKSRPDHVKTQAEAIHSLEKFGAEGVKIFQRWVNMFEVSQL